MKSLPFRGCGVERRLRRMQRDGAGAAVAECKRRSKARSMMRKPQPVGSCRRQTEGWELSGQRSRCLWQDPSGRCAASSPMRGAFRRGQDPALQCRREHPAYCSDGLTARPTRIIKRPANIFPQTQPTGRLCAAPTACRFRRAAFYSRPAQGRGTKPSPPLPCPRPSTAAPQNSLRFWRFRGILYIGRSPLFSGRKPECEV